MADHLCGATDVCQESGEAWTQDDGRGEVSGASFDGASDQDWAAFAACEVAALGAELFGLTDALDHTHKTSLTRALASALFAPLTDSRIGALSLGLAMFIRAAYPFVSTGGSGAADAFAFADAPSDLSVLLATYPQHPFSLTDLMGLEDRLPLTDALALAAPLLLADALALTASFGRTVGMVGAFLLEQAAFDPSADRLLFADAVPIAPTDIAALYLLITADGDDATSAHPSTSLLPPRHFCDMTGRGCHRAL